MNKLCTTTLALLVPLLAALTVLEPDPKEDHAGTDIVHRVQSTDKPLLWRLRLFQPRRGNGPQRQKSPVWFSMT